MARAIGLDFSLLRKDGRPRFEVHSVRPALRATADGEPRTDVVAVITQQRRAPIDAKRRDTPADQLRDDETFVFRGGCTLLLDREYNSDPIRYAICRPINDRDREDEIRRYVCAPAESVYDDIVQKAREPFRAFHAAVH